jgi:hypothetical protein
VSAHLGSFPVIPAQAGIQGFQTLVLGPRFRGDDDFGWTAEFSHSLDPFRTFAPAPILPRQSAGTGRRSKSPNAYILQLCFVLLRQPACAWALRLVEESGRNLSFL